MNILVETDTNPVLETSQKLDRRTAIFALQDKMKQLPGHWEGDNDNCPLKHSFADGVYVREIFIPEGTLLIGKIHKHSHPNFLMYGVVSVFTEEGPKKLVGPCSMISPAGTKRVVYAHTNVVWITVHVTKETDLKKIEDEIIAKDYTQLENVNTPKLVTAEI